MPLDILQRVFGYDAFRPFQEDVVNSLLAGEDVLAVMPTGSGKSMCYQIPALKRGGLTIVVSPLIALMEDQVAALKLAGVAADAINGSRDRADNVAVWRQAAAGELTLLYLAPERLMTPRMLTALQKLPVTQFAVDEAHCMSRWGPAFRPEYEALKDLKQHFPGVPIAALTATADKTTQTDIVEKLFHGQGRTIVAGFDRPNIRLSVAPRQDRRGQLLDFVADHAGESGIVYCLSRKKTEETALQLQVAGYNALPYHAGMEQMDRQRHQDIFMAEPGVIIVATIAFGMGIDKPDVRFVFHTDMPGNVEAYYQEIGRAGRDGAPAEALMLYGLDDLRMRRMFIDQEDSDADHKRREHKRLDALVAICEAATCRRQALLAYFGEESGPCGNCDNCLDPPDLVDGTESARAACRTVLETGQRFGAAHIIDILSGANTAKIRQFRHDELSTYGKGREHSKPAWRSILRQMLAAGLLELDIAGYGGLRLTGSGGDLLDGRRKFEHRREALKPKSKGKAKAPTVSAQDFGEADGELYLALKDLRKDLAQARRVPAYVIFPDRSLQDMVRRKPRTVDDFAQVHGVGAAKLEKFAEPFLDVIRQSA